MSDNGPNKALIEIDVGDAPMIAHALRIGANTALLCGRQDARARLQAYGKVVAALAPPSARFFDEEGWAEMCMALCAASGFTVALEDQRGYMWGFHGVLVVTIGDDTWAGKRERDGLPRDTPEAQALFDALSAYAPLGCEGVLKGVAACG